MNKLLAGLIVRGRYAKKALSEIEKPHIGDIVSYKGKEHQLIQGVANPYWDLLDLSPENLSLPQRHIERSVHISEFRLQPMYKRFLFSFRFTYRFYMNYWYRIEVDQLIHKMKKA